MIRNNYIYIYIYIYMLEIRGSQNLAKLRGGGGKAIRGGRTGEK